MFKFLTKFSDAVVGTLEGFFFWYGFKVAQYPWYFVAGCLILSGLCGIGLINYTEENNAFRLWIPEESEFVKNYEWLQKNYPPDARYSNIIITSIGDKENVLTADVLQMVLQLHLDVEEDIVTKPNDQKWGEICQQVPTATGITAAAPELALEKLLQMKKINCSDPILDPTDPDFPDFMNICQHEAYCDLWDQLYEQSLTCFEPGILELFGFDESAYVGLTDQDVIDKVNEENLQSAIFGLPLDVEKFIATRRDEATGKIVGASAISQTWFGKVNQSSLSEDALQNAEDGQAADETTLDFEDKFRKLMENFGQDVLQPKGLDIYVTVARGYSDVAGEQIMNDAILMPVGFTIVGIYVVLMLGHFSCVDTRALLSGVGLGIIGLTILVTYGLCSAFGLFYGPMHNAIPFLFLGIGIDDMFVIMQSLDNLAPHERQLNNIPQNLGQTMKHAGVAITVTSVTDIVVFAVGSSTQLPALRSFCLYCAVGIFAVFVFQATLFVACVALDLRRLDQNRNGFLVCYKHRNHTKTEVTGQLNLRRKIFRKIGWAINTIVGKIAVFAVTFTLLGVGIWGVTELETKFDSVWFLPQDSYVAQWSLAQEKYFPGDGERVTVYIKDVNFTSDLPKIGELVDILSNSPEIISSVKSWYPPLEAYINGPLGFGPPGLPDQVLQQDLFLNFTSYFLFSPSGASFQPNFKTAEELECNEMISHINMSTFEFVHRRFNSTAEHIDGMQKVYDIIAELDFTNGVFPTTQEYANWETDAVISKELYRNVGLSMACVFVTMLILLADIWGSILVMVCVLTTLIDVMGFMHFWGLTIDVVSSIIIIISIGLCVDYSAHIGHAFLTEQGSRSERSKLALQNIGPAVLNGGFSTFLALVLLASSDSYVFSTFFKVFFLVIVFGLFHGLIFLPAVLGLMGPRAYSHNDNKNLDSESSEGNPVYQNGGAKPMEASRL